MNYTLPGRLHLIVKRRLLYATLWLFGQRFHWGMGSNVVSQQAR